MNLIKAERRARRWSQTVLGFHVGLAQSDISQIECGHAIPTPAQAERLSRVLGVPADALLREVRGPSAPAPAPVEASHD